MLNIFSDQPSNVISTRLIVLYKYKYFAIF